MLSTLHGQIQRDMTINMIYLQTKRFNFNQQEALCHKIRKYRKIQHMYIKMLILYNIFQMLDKKHP